jgi:hypothetical protein
MRTFWACTVVLIFFFVTISRAVADDKPTNLSDAQAAVEANLKTSEGKTYDEQLGKEFPEKYLSTLRQCKQTFGASASFWILMRLDQDGTVREVLLYPATKVGTCAREVLLKGKFSPPPRAAYWVSIYLKTAN